MQAGPVRLLVFLLLAINVLEAQSSQKHSGGTAPGSLQVTVTVVPSVWLVMDPDGKLEAVVANAPDPTDSFVHAAAPQKRQAAKTASRKSRTPAPAQQTPAGPVPGIQPRDHGNAPLQFSLPKPKQFEVKHEIKMMDVEVNGKTERRPVTVTTVVPQ